VQFDVTPSLGESETDALRAAFEHVELDIRRGSEPYGSAWRRAGLFEAADREDDAGYAFSPRSTRGATRA